jgi:hypothetical protein
MRYMRVVLAAHMLDHVDIRPRQRSDIRRNGAAIDLSGRVVVDAGDESRRQRQFKASANGVRAGGRRLLWINVRAHPTCLFDRASQQDAEEPTMSPVAYPGSPARSGRSLVP